ncbi:MAG TPA: hypothetical protein VKA07_03245 [Candidatus Sulfotelmatobacter sp.]|nr:hypothetical protein [Candidatus Sulfotelmatobacter sp.]
MSRLIQAARIVLAVLREIFDEAAYARFLRRAQIESSSAAYAEFCREREASHARRPRCC